MKAADKLREWREHPSVYVRETWGIEPDGWQEEALEAYGRSPRLAMRACAGPGKLQPYSMEIETPSGLKRWGDLQSGDLIFAQDGSPVKIIARHEQGIVPIYRVMFDDGSSSRCGLDHLWKVRGRTERRHFKLMQTGRWTEKSENQCLAKGYPITPKNGYSVLTTNQIIIRNNCNDGNSRNQFEIPRQDAVQFCHANQPLDSYLTGIWIGDGKKSDPSYSKPYFEVEKEINCRGYKTSRHSDGNHVRVLASAQLFSELDCYPFGSHERFIPNNYKYASINQRIDLISGIMDADGCVGDDGHMEYATTSERLANDVVWVVRSLGGVAFIKASIKEGWYRNSVGERVDCRDCYRVTVVLPFNPFRIKHKADRWKDPARSPKSLRYMTRFIVSIEPDGEEEAMCIEVDHPSHCYLANDFIVTHNSAVLAWIGWNFLETRPHPKIGVTSIDAKNLSAGLWSEFAKWRNKSPRLQSLFEQTGSKIYYREYPETWKLEARTWAKDANPEQAGNTLSGLHADYVMWLMDESGAYPDSILPTAEAIFQGSPKEAHIIQAGNPTHLSGPLYLASVKAKHLWYVISITGDPDDPKRSSRIPIDHAREQIALYGRDNPWVMSKILGLFPPSSINSLIGPDEIEAAFNRVYTPYDIGNMARVLGVDVAREGSDQSVIFPRQGIQAFNPICKRNITSDQGAGLVARKWDDWSAQAVFIDATGGFGSGWIDQLKLLGKTAIPVQFAGQAHDPKKCFNKRTEMYLDCVAWIKAGGSLPRMPELVAEFCEPTYSFKGDRLLLEPKDLIKKRLGRSPDLADALVLTFAEPVSPPVPKIIARKQNAEAYDPFASMSHVSSVAASYDPFR